MKPDRVEFRCRPLEGWPQAFTDPRRSAPFRATYSNTMELLRREVSKIAKPPEYGWSVHVSIQLAITEGDIRLDGQPRASASPAHPGVAVGFESIHGPLRYFADSFTKWKDNVRAVALGLESLRRVDRYGISRRGEQYRGWAELPAGNGDLGASHLTLEGATELFSSFSGLSPATVTTYGGLRAAWLAVAKAKHPDVGGDPEEFHLYKTAYDIIRRTL